MSAPLQRLCPRSFALVVCFALLACGDEAPQPLEPAATVLHDGGGDASSFRVYTQNAYLGGDTGPLFTIGDFTDFEEVAAAASTFWSQVVSSDIPQRTSRFVDRIEETLPHVVALQEALRFVVLDASFTPTGGLDILAAVQAQIVARGLPYEVAIVQNATSSTLPLTTDGAGGVTSWLNFTDRVVLLKRNDVTTLATAQGPYAASLPLGPLEFRRGWGRLTVEHAGIPHHVIATHLEVQALLPIHSAQAAELQNVVAAGLEGVTIIAGDLNSDADAAPGDPSWTPTYGNLIGAGFTDVWASAPPKRASQEGLTCCREPTLTLPDPLDERIDFVLMRASDGTGAPIAIERGWLRAEVVGDEPEDRTDSGLWPSDHAGIVASLRIELE